jgi:hypothetical protein
MSPSTSLIAIAPRTGTSRCMPADVARRKIGVSGSQQETSGVAYFDAYDTPIHAGVSGRMCTA